MINISKISVVMDLREWTMGGSPLLLGDFYTISFVLYISVPYADYISKKRSYQK